MDLENYTYFKQLSFLRKIIENRQKGTWIAVFTPDYSTEQIVRKQIKNEFKNFCIAEIDFSKKK